MFGFLGVEVLDYCLIRKLGDWMVGWLGDWKIDDLMVDRMIG